MCCRDSVRLFLQIRKFQADFNVRYALACRDVTNRLLVFNERPC